MTKEEMAQAYVKTLPHWVQQFAADALMAYIAGFDAAYAQAKREAQGEIEDAKSAACELVERANRQRMEAEEQLEAAKAEIDELIGKLSIADRVSNKEQFQRFQAITMDYAKQLSEERARGEKLVKLCNDILAEVTGYAQGRYVDGKEIEIKHESDYEFYPNHLDIETLREFRTTLANLEGGSK